MVQSGSELHGIAGVDDFRLPPQNAEAEQAVLGSMLLAEEAVVQAAELLDAAAFYTPTHQKVFSALLDLYKASVPVDLITATDALRKAGQLEEVGGASYLAASRAVSPPRRTPSTTAPS